MSFTKPPLSQTPIGHTLGSATSPDATTRGRTDDPSGELAAKCLLEFNTINRATKLTREDTAALLGADTSARPNSGEDLTNVFKYLTIVSGMVSTAVHVPHLPVSESPSRAQEAVSRCCYLLEQCDGNVDVMEWILENGIVRRTDLIDSGKTETPIGEIFATAKQWFDVQDGIARAGKRLSDIGQSL